MAKPASSAVPAGRDARLPRWLGRRPGREARRFDSVVIRGAGIGALICAARLARSDAFAGRVRIAAPRPRPGRRLVNGCTLRARTLDYAGAALGVPAETLADDLFGAERHKASTWAQDFALAPPHPGALDLRGPTPWMEAEPGRPLAYGLRNGHLVDRLARAVDLEVPFADTLAPSLEACLDQAPGDRPMVLDASHEPLSDVPAPAKPERFVVASQVPLRRRDGAALAAGHSCIGMRHRDGWFDTGVFYPFHDPLTPAADFYGIFYRIVRASAPGFDKAREIAAMREIDEAFADALGLDPVDAEATRGEAMVPCIPWSDVTTHRADYMDLFRTYSACTPIITGDGMTRGALAGWLCAEALLAGEDPVSATNRSLRRWRSANRNFARGMTGLSRPLGAALRRAPRLVLRPVAAQPHMWARVA